MKILKLGLFSLLAILAVSVFLASCEQEEVTNQIQEETELINHALEKQLEESVTFEKNLVIENRAEKKLGINNVDIIIKSNDEDILKHFNKNSISLEMGEITIEEDQSDNIEDKANEVTTADNLSGFEENQKFVQIILQGSGNAPTSTENLAFSVDFSDELVEEIRRNKIATVIDFGTDKSEIQSKNYWVWSTNKRVKIKGDGGNINTRTDNYWAYTGSSTHYYLNSSNFRHTAYASVCCLSYNSSKWVRRVIVKQDVCRGVSGIWSACYYSTCR